MMAATPMPTPTPTRDDACDAAAAAPPMPTPVALDASAAIVALAVPLAVAVSVTVGVARAVPDADNAAVGVVEAGGAAGVPLRLPGGDDDGGAVRDADAAGVGDALGDDDTGGSAGDGESVRVDRDDSDTTGVGVPLTVDVPVVD